VLLRGGRVVDPATGRDGVADVLLMGGKVEAVGTGLGQPDEALVRVVEGMVVAPGLIDLHVHLREPGAEHKETIASGARAASAGGFTSICAMPNTQPPVDAPATVGFVRAEGLRARAARVYPVGCISLGQKGEQLAEIGEMVEAGAVAITDDGRPVESAGLMRLALEYATSFGIPVADHCEDRTLSRGGSMNEGLTSARLGLIGIPNAAEDTMIARDLMLAELTSGRLHIQHVSTRFGVELIRGAKARGVRVTAEATPHHLVLTDAAADGYRTEAKVNPPLRSEADRAAVVAGFADGTLDVLATDHAPHHYDEKEQAFEDAPFGLVGLETALGLVHTELVLNDVISLATMVERMSAAPARAFGLPGGSLAPGMPADVVVFDPAAEWIVDPAQFQSKSRNTPFTGRRLKGRVLLTLVGGELVWDADSRGP
jgi:dihydroorotase